jgi:hypothetical protein
MLPATLRDTRRPLAATAAPVDRGVRFRLKFSVEKQIQTQWCWAAVAISVERYYRPGTSWEQCAIAAKERRADCCRDGSSSACNQPYFLDRAFECTGTFGEYFSRSLGPREVRKEIERRAPLGCRVGWVAGGGHFVVIAGYELEDGEMFVHVEDPDPFFASATFSFEEFSHRYRGAGRWTHSYTTRGETVRSPEEAPMEHAVRPGNLTN